MNGKPKTGCDNAYGDREKGKEEVNLGRDKTSWEVKAQAAFDKYLADVKASLPPDANFYSICEGMRIVESEIDLL